MLDCVFGFFRLVFELDSILDAFLFGDQDLREASPFTRIGSSGNPWNIQTDSRDYIGAEQKPLFLFPRHLSQYAKSILLPVNVYSKSYIYFVYFDTKF